MSPNYPAPPFATNPIGFRGFWHQGGFVRPNYPDVFILKTSDTKEMADSKPPALENFKDNSSELRFNLSKVESRTSAINGPLGDSDIDRWDRM